MNKLYLPKDGRTSKPIMKKCNECRQTMQVHRAKRKCPFCGSVGELEAVYHIGNVNEISEGGEE